MQKRTREILALVLLGVLAIVGVGAMAWYILVGHSWNVAASNIDDSIGQMDGYIVILHEAPGTASGEGGKPASAEGQAIDVQGVAADYRSKGASVVVATADDFTRHRQPFIIRRTGKRLGFLSVGNSELRSDVRADIAYLRQAGADCVIALSDDLTLGSLSADGVIDGLFLIVFDNSGKSVPDGEYRGPAYCVSTPEPGKVGAVIMSPSGVLSSKTIDELKDVDESDEP